MSCFLKLNEYNSGGSSLHLGGHLQLWGGGYWTYFIRSVIFPFFQDDQNTGYLYDVTFIFDRCHRSWAAETPDKYERYWKYISYTLGKSKFPVMEKLTNGALVTPTPDTPL